MEMNTMSDWEEWARLAKEDPQRFESERAAAIEKMIMSQPIEHRRRSRQLQWKIDMVRRGAPNSLASCIRVFDMMMDSVYGPHGLLEAVNLLGGGSNPPMPSARPKTGRVLEFKGNSSAKTRSSA